MENLNLDEADEMLKNMVNGGVKLNPAQALASKILIESRVQLMIFGALGELLGVDLSEEDRALVVAIRDELKRSNINILYAIEPFILKQ